MRFFLVQLMTLQQTLGIKSLAQRDVSELDNSNLSNFLLQNIGPDKHAYN